MHQTELREVLSQCPCFNNSADMLPPSTTTQRPTYPPGFHEPLEQFNWGQGWARPAPSEPESDDAIFHPDDVTVTSLPSHQSKTTTKPEFYDEDSIGRFLFLLTQSFFFHHLYSCTSPEERCPFLMCYGSNFPRVTTALYLFTYVLPSPKTTTKF